MTTITLQVPDTLADSQQEIARFLAAKLYESGKLTLGQAAEIAGMKKWDFAEILVDYGVHYLDLTASEDLTNEIKASEDNFFALAGMWQDRDISAEELRTRAWPKRR